MLGHYFSILLRRQECLGKGMWEVIVSKRMFGENCREKGCGENSVEKKMG